MIRRIDMPVRGHQMAVEEASRDTPVASAGVDAHHRDMTSCAEETRQADEYEHALHIRHVEQPQHMNGTETHGRHSALCSSLLL
jgi:hypothetical protein